MANCPKCGYHLKLTDIKPECPQCGVNVVYYHIEDRLREDADKAELEQAKFQPKMDRLKASVFGSPLAIVRIVCILLPIITLLLPLAKISTDLPFSAETTTINLVAVYNFISNADIGLLFNLFGSKVLGTDFIFFTAAFVTLLLSVVCMLLNLVFLVMSFGKRGLRRNVTTNIIGAVFLVASMICFTLSAKGFEKDAAGLFTAGSVQWGAFIVLLAFVILIVVNLLFKVLKIEVKYTDVSELLLPYHERKAFKEEQARLAAESDETKAAEALKEAEERLKAIHEQNEQHGKKHKK